ncbi:sulfite exporter TauE/SafE family protein [Oceaniglobus ichthyenteri]|uniref:sulfite exporter TauE/SafE family protein n=1 Tax=Oceaniglobus ichthyenteri TaxID=2136177 RepID=UPI000D35FF0C|nr:sulfite exporter TauE/SafE family protein [Oceaniglobus ichthyenteri]
MIELTALGYSAVFIALALGGMLKGATGMGVPIMAIPVMAAFFDVRLAVALMVLPSLGTNFWQLWQYRHHRSGGLGWRMAISGAAGVVLGSVLLVTMPVRALTLIVAFAVLGYIALRLLRAEFALSPVQARRIVLPMGLAAGVLQGAGGISSPVSVSFLNAAQLPRPVFIATLSLFFIAISAVQLPTLAALGFYTPQMLLLSALAVIPVLAFMPVGAYLARAISPKAFDRLILGVLTGLAIKLIFWP